MSSLEKFKSLINDLSAVMRDAAFERTGLVFRRHDGDNVAVIAAQKSSRSSTDEVVFTFNLGVWSRAVAEMTAGGVVKKIDVADCHWTVRVGELLEPPEDKWWALNASTDEGRLRFELYDVLRHRAIPELLAHTDDRRLRDLWRSGRSPGATDFQRLLFLTSVLATLGPKVDLDHAVMELRQVSDGRATAAVVARHLKRLGVQ